MNPNNKAVLDQFQKRLANSFTEFCTKHQLCATDPKNFITYLIDHNVINATTIRRYTILKEIKQMEGRKTENVRKIASRFNISQRSVYNILKEYKNRFDYDQEA